MRGIKDRYDINIVSKEVDMKMDKIVYENSKENLKKFEESMEKGVEKEVIECMVELVKECGDCLVDYIVKREVEDKDGDRWNDLSEMMWIEMGRGI